MKKISFIALTCLVAFSLTSCGSDEGCSFKGNWKVKSADIQSSRLPEATLQIAKEDMLATIYEFEKDGKIAIRTNSGGKGRQGTWAFNKTGSEVSWTTKAADGEDYVETSIVNNCSASEISLSQRMPSDTTKEEIARVVFVLERIK